MNAKSYPTGSDDPVQTLEAALTVDAFESGHYAFVCPVTGDVLTNEAETEERYLEGIPSKFRVGLTRTCACGNEHTLVDIVVVPGDMVGTISPSECREAVVAWWEETLRVGHKSLDGLASTTERCQMYDAKATEFEWDWRVKCPLCTRTRNELGVIALKYHHWHYDADIGTLVCKYCHDTIHNQEKAKDLKSEASACGLNGYLSLAVIRLSDLHIKYHGPPDDWKAHAATIASRYNVPLTPAEVHQLLTEAKNNPDIDEYRTEY